MRLFFVSLCILLLPKALLAEQIPVRFAEGSAHGFLQLRGPDGKIIADGDFTQSARNGRVTDHLVFRFADGSLQEETTIFSQRGHFQLISTHLVQKGPSFPSPTDTLLDAATGQLTVHALDNGKDTVIRKRLALPPDVSNGMMLTLAKNISPQASQTTVSLVARGAKPKLVKLLISPEATETFSLGTISYKAVRYVVKVKIEGAAGVVAPLVGQQPPDFHIWVTEGEAPTFLGSEGPFFKDGPIWRIELATPKPAKQ
jgi:hypothetical protein